MKFQIWDNTRTVEVKDENIEILKIMGSNLQYRYIQHLLRIEGITEETQIDDKELQSVVDQLIAEEIQAGTEIISIVLEKQKRGEL